MASGGASHRKTARRKRLQMVKAAASPWESSQQYISRQMDRYSCSQLFYIVRRPDAASFRYS
jgi:hypothetical protein